MRYTIYRILLPLVMLAAACTRYTWVNDSYSAAEMQDNYVLDRGNCVREANATYPEPYPVQDPEQAYYECMARNTRDGTVAGRTAYGEFVYGRVRTTPNPYACAPTYEHKRRYEEYTETLSAQERQRAAYVNSCMSILGWEKVLEDEG